MFTGSGSTNFHLGAPLGQYFAKPGVCNLLIKVVTLGQLTRLISPGRHVLWPQGKLKHIRNILSEKENLFVKVKEDHFAETTGRKRHWGWFVPSFMQKLRHYIPKQRLKVRLSFQEQGKLIPFCKWGHFKGKWSGRGQKLQGEPPRLRPKRSLSQHSWAPRSLRDLDNFPSSSANMVETGMDVEWPMGTDGNGTA